MQDDQALPAADASPRPCKTRLGLTRPGESLRKFSTEGWVVPANQIPPGTEIILEWETCYLPVQFPEPFRAVVLGGWFNGVTSVEMEDGTRLNLGPRHWPHLWIVEQDEQARDAAGKES